MQVEAPAGQIRRRCRWVVQMGQACLSAVMAWYIFWVLCISGWCAGAESFAVGRGFVARSLPSHGAAVGGKGLRKDPWPNWTP